MTKEEIRNLKLKVLEAYKKLDITIDGRHIYKDSKKQYYTGVTTIIGIKDKPFLVGWAAKEVYLYLKSNWNLRKTYNAAEKESLLKIAKTTHLRKRDRGANAGTVAHDWIEKYIKGKKPVLPKEGDLDSKKNILTAKIAEQANNSISSFLKWEKEYNPIWIASEMIVASKTHKFAGTLDALAIIGGKFFLMDFKTSNRLGEDVFLQTAGYQISLEEMGIYPEERAVLRLPKTKEDAEFMVIMSEIEFDKEVFLHCREIHRWNVYIKKNFKDEQQFLLHHNKKITYELTKGRECVWCGRAHAEEKKNGTKEKRNNSL